MVSVFAISGGHQQQKTCLLLIQKILTLEVSKNLYYNIS